MANNKLSTLGQLRQLAVRCLAAIDGKIEEVAQDTTEAINGVIAKFNEHAEKSTLHITDGERTHWNDAKEHADSDHAPSDAEKNVQSDWNVTDTSSNAFIKNKPAIPTVPTKVSELTNDRGFLTSETDPTVPSWAKQANKPSYTASEVGASPTGHKHTKSEITDFPTSMPPTAHNHDDRYYTESEMDTKLAGKAPAYTYGTQDIQAGSASTEPNGALHFVYE